MKKLGKKFLIGTAFAASAVMLMGCVPEDSAYKLQNGSFDTTTEVPVAVYGPPEDFSTTKAPAEETTGLEFEVTTEINEDVYGPPVEDAR